MRKLLTHLMPAYEEDEVHNIISTCPPWWHSKGLIKLYIVLFSPMLTSAAWGFDLSMTNSLQSLNQFMDSFGNPTGSRLGFFGASSSVGGIVASIVGGPLNERFGRRVLLFSGAIIVVAMAIMETFASSFNMFIAGKMILGFGANLQGVVGPVLVTELAHPKQRETITSIFNTSIYIGLILGSWIAFGTHAMDSQWSWRIPCIVQLVLPAFQICTIWFCPESPRWLVSKGHIEKARAILIKYHGSGIEDEVVGIEMQEIIIGLNADKTNLKFNMEGIKTILGSRGNLHRLWICFWNAIPSQCGGSNFISTYLPQILIQIGMPGSREQTLINGVSNIWCWVCALSSAFLVTRLRRRTIYMTSILGMLASMIVWTGMAAAFLETNKRRFGIGVLVMIFVFNFFNAVAWITLVVTYPLECVTTKQRSVFYAFTVFIINASSFVISYINPIGIENITWRYYIVQCVFDVIIAVIIYTTFPETSGLTLEEIAVLFDGEQAMELTEDMIKDKSEHVENGDAGSRGSVDIDVESRRT